MPLIGLTGGYATGKSLVLSVFRRLGAHVIDCDLIARQVVEKGEEGLEKVKEAFGPGALAPDGSLDRGKVADMVFSDPALRMKLEGLLHPLIIGRVNERAAGILKADRKAMVVVDAPLLFEAGMAEGMDATVVVACGLEEQVRRGMARDGLSREQVMARIGAQAPLADKIAKAGYVIYNTANREEAERAAADTWGKIINK